MSRRFIKQFGKINVELEIEMDEDPSTQCDLIHASYSASLCVASNSGELETGNGDTYTIPAAILTRIELWAELTGY